MANTLEIITKLSKKGAKPEMLQALARWFDHYAPRFGVNTPKRKSAFLSNAAHETDGFRSLEEYASGQAYEGRKDLGNINPGDGVKFKGHGIFQTTGRLNHIAAGKEIKKIEGVDLELEKHPEKLTLPQWAVLSAFIYWRDRNLNAIADLPDTWRSKPVKIRGVEKTLTPFQYISYRINGGQNGINEREKFYALALQLVNVAKDNPLTTIFVLVVLVGILYTISK